MAQYYLFQALPPLPEGFYYQPEFISSEEEKKLAQMIEALPFEKFNFQGYTAKREVVEYGWEYDFSDQQARPADLLPEFLHPLRQRAAGFAGVRAEELVEAVTTRYPPGAPIGWHRDAPPFEIIVGISLLGECRFRLRPHGRRGKIVALELPPRSAYIMSGPARWEWQHSISPLQTLRYSVTFRTLR